MDNDEAIEFTVIKSTAKNIEFCVNGDSKHLIWFSQLNEVFFKMDSMYPCAGKIIKKDGSYLYIWKMSPTEFLEYVRGKKFRVSINPDGDIAKFKGDAFQAGTTYDEAAAFIRKLASEGKCDEAIGYLMDGREYSFIEI